MSEVFIIVTLEDADFHRQVELPSGAELVLGRDDNCSLPIGHRSLSRQHLRIAEDQGRWQVADLGSTNGARVNGVRIQVPVPLAHGDVIQAGVTRIVFHGPAGTVEQPSSYHYMDEPAAVSSRRPAVEPKNQDETATSRIAPFITSDEIECDIDSDQIDWDT